MRGTFATAAALLDHPAEQVAIPFEGTLLPGYLFRPDNSGEPRPTLIYHGGYDSVLEEAYFAAAAGAVHRGYNCLTFDGPGQGAVLRDQHLTFRADWDTVVSAAADYAIKRPEVDSERLALMGTSFGGFLAARAAGAGRWRVEDGLESRSCARQPDRASCLSLTMFSSIGLSWPSSGMMAHAAR